MPENGHFKGLSRYSETPDIASVKSRIGRKNFARNNDATLGLVRRGFSKRRHSARMILAL